MGRERERAQAVRRQRRRRTGLGPGYLLALGASTVALILAAGFLVTQVRAIVRAGDSQATPSPTRNATPIMLQMVAPPTSGPGGLPPALLGPTVAPPAAVEPAAPSPTAPSVPSREDPRIERALQQLTTNADRI